MAVAAHGQGATYYSCGPYTAPNPEQFAVQNGAPYPGHYPMQNKGQYAVHNVGFRVRLCTILGTTMYWKYTRCNIETTY